MFYVAIGLLIVAGAAAILAGDGGTIAGVRTEIMASAIASVAVLLFVGGALSDYAGRLGTAARDAVIWIGFGLLLILGYSYRDDLRPLYDRVAGELAPAGTNLTVAGTERGERAVRVRKRVDGHFAVQTKVNGRTLTMLVDTGASTVVLTSDDAERVGLDVNQLAFAIPISTANGTGFAARVRLNSLAIGGIQQGPLTALVAKPGALSESLLGMNFLQRLRSYQVQGDFLTLRG
ncbi:MAG: TIGR02281 family clan AA aspartic protease [Pseudomonadota bacterium]